MAKSGFVGACGEFYVAAYLSKFNFLVALPRAGVPGSDLFVSTVNHGRPIRLQVKTGTQSRKRIKPEGQIYYWPTSLNVIDAPHDDYLWYAYVSLNGWPEDEAKIPEVFFVPSTKVVETIKGIKAEIEESPKTWPCFWMQENEAKDYIGQKGLELLRAVASALE